MKTVPVGSSHAALVDDADYLRVAGFRWYRFGRRRARTSYAYRYVAPDGAPGDSHTPGVTWEYMHRLITGYGEVDHCDGDGLNNQQSNLRESTRTQQRANTAKQRGSYTSAFKGVSWDKARSKWKASIQVSGKSIHLGRFHDEQDAARAYNAAAIHHFGRFAKTNQPQGEHRVTRND